MENLSIYGTLIVLAHATVVFWHLQLLARLNSTLTLEHALLFASLANLVPMTALILFWTHFRKIGGWLLLIFLAIPLTIGGYEHFLSSGADNVFRMAPGEGALAFRISAILLVILEALGCWVSVRIIGGSERLNAKA